MTLLETAHSVSGNPGRILLDIPAWVLFNELKFDILNLSLINRAQVANLTQSDPASRTSQPTKRGYQVPAVVRAIDILEFISARGEVSFTEIFSRLGLPKSTTYQILSTLSSRGLVRHEGDSAKYSLGLRLLEMGTRAAARLDIRSEAMPVLRDLVARTNETCHLGVLDGTEGVYLAKVEGTRPVRLHSWEGKRLPLHCTAMGKTLLAWQKPQPLKDILDRIELRQATPKTITDRTELEAHLKLVRERGWALDDQENEADIRCLSAPVMTIGGRVAAAISISGLASRLEGAYLLELSRLVQEAGRELSRKLGNG